jgi:hypothetical protein
MTMANAPSVGRDGESYSLICASEKQKYFCKRGWTGGFGNREVICPSGQAACPISAVRALNLDIVRANCRQIHRQPWTPVQRRGIHMRFEIVAEKESETVRMKRNSSLIAIAKARVWASEGWNVTIVVDDNASGLVEEFSLSAA